MSRKLSEMNAVISRLKEAMPEDCVLFVMGDHGMTTTGNNIIIIKIGREAIVKWKACLLVTQRPWVRFLWHPNVFLSPRA